LGLWIIVDETYGTDKLAFPTSENEIVEALSLKDGRTEYMGVMYESISGKVYKVINGKRYQLRGLRIIADSPLAPKAGALVQFDYDSAQIRRESYPLLDEFGKALSDGLVDAAVVISGHTDNIGSMDYNQRLSENRAKAVENYLCRHHGIDPERIEIKGYGETRPIASNETEEGRSKNRRVEFCRVE
jgi:outer membrane protein OmpA-like peptidoglycan-associated protein